MALTTDSAGKDPKKPSAKPDAKPDGKANGAPGGDGSLDKPNTDDREKMPAAGEATDPDVQKLLAEQQTAIQNGDDEAIERIGRRLGELGYK